MKFEDIKTNCRSFKGDIPCKPHKQYAVHCLNIKRESCGYYNPTKKKVLIIKLSAIGDVIRTTPLIRKIKRSFPDMQVWWITMTPEVLPDVVDVILDFSIKSILILLATHFEIIYNLDKDKEACALTNLMSADIKKGFELKGGKCSPIDKDAEHKFMTGVFDDLSKTNKKTYQEEIFEICGFNFSGEKYILNNYSSERYQWNLKRSKGIIGLNTGCGDRWTSRLWPAKKWSELAKQLKKEGFEPLLLGGPLEHKKNLKIARYSGAMYLGYFPLKQFINLVYQCDLIITAVTMAAHIAIGLQKKIILLNNVFNRDEFELYGIGKIIEPARKCKCFYSPICTNKEYNCMEYITVKRVLKTCLKLLRDRKLTLVR